MRALSLVVACFFNAEARLQPEDWDPTVKTIENGNDNFSSISYDELSDMDILEELSRFTPSDFEYQTLLKQVESFLQGPLDTFKEINSVGSKGIASSVHENISYLYVKLFTYLIHGYAWMSRSLVGRFKTIRGDLCYQIPDIEKFHNFFVLKGGEICPFDDFEMQNVTVKKSEDKWVVELPIVVRKVKVVFASIQLYTPLLSTPAWTFESKDVLVKITMGMAKSLMPYPISLDMGVKVEGCDISDPNSNWIIRKLLKLSSKICDPILNEVIRLSLFVVRTDMKIFAWVAKRLFNGDMRTYAVIQWALTKAHKLIQSQVN